jgi:hypothetical protein
MRAESSLARVCVGPGVTCQGAHTRSAHVQEVSRAPVPISVGAFVSVRDVASLSALLSRGSLERFSLSAGQGSSQDVHGA